MSRTRAAEQSVIAPDFTRARVASDARFALVAEIKLQLGW